MPTHKPRIDRNIEPIDLAAMPPEQARLLKLILRGALDVADAKERGER